MSDTIQTMRTEHMNLLRLLHLLEREMGVFARGDKADFELITDMLDYVGNYFERIHHPKEEAMVEHLRERAPDLEPQLTGMKQEHERLGELLHRFRATVDDIVMGSDMMPREAINDMATQLITLNREHIKHEEQFIFPRALAKLREKDWLLIAAGSPESTDPLFGAEVQDQYRDLLKRLLSPGGA